MVLKNYHNKQYFRGVFVPFLVPFFVVVVVALKLERVSTKSDPFDEKYFFVINI